MASMAFCLLCWCEHDAFAWDEAWFGSLLFSLIMKWKSGNDIAVGLS